MNQVPQHIKVAVAKFLQKGFDYDAAWAASAAAKDEVGQALEVLNALVPAAPEGAPVTLHGDGRFGMDDLLYLPDLRRLTCVAGVRWPERLQKYVQDSCRAGGVRLYSDWAVP